MTDARKINWPKLIANALAVLAISAALYLWRPGTPCQELQHVIATLLANLLGLWQSPPYRTTGPTKLR